MSAELHPGRQTGPKRVHFTLWTDSKDRPVWSLAMAASLVADWEIRDEAASDASVPIGRPGIQRYTVIGRRIDREGRGAPSCVDAAAPAVASFAGPPRERRRADGVVETERTVEVRLPALTTGGTQRSELVFHWPEEASEERHLISWEVEPRIHVAPQGLVLTASGGQDSRAILLRSDDRPFRIVGIEGALLGEPSPRIAAGPNRVHRLDLALDPGKLEAGGTSEIRFMTDPTLTSRSSRSA